MKGAAAHRREETVAGPGNGRDDDPLAEMWSKTVFGVMRMQDAYPERFEPGDEKAPYGYYKDPSRPGDRFPIIGRDNEVRGGVYIGEHGREIILVEEVGRWDDKRSLHGVYEHVRTALIAMLKFRRITSEDTVIQAVFEIVKEHMRYSEGSVDRLTEGKRDQLVPLEDFLQKKVGVCRHQALLGAYILQRLKRERILENRIQISTDRNSLYGGGHAWVRVTLSDGQVMIMDPAQNYCGFLREAGERKRGWVYDRPEDVRGEVAEERGRVVRLVRPPERHRPVEAMMIIRNGVDLDDFIHDEFIPFLLDQPDCPATDFATRWGWITGVVRDFRESRGRTRAALETDVVRLLRQRLDRAEDDKTAPLDLLEEYLVTEYLGGRI